jgi:hypothetical protein
MPSDERFDRVVTEADPGCRSRKSFTGINGTTEVVLFHSVSFPLVLFVSCGLVFAGNCQVFWRTAEAAVST